MNPSPAHEQLLRRLRQQLHYHNGGASVVYLFSDYTLANQWLMAELDAHVLTPASATEAPAALLQPVLASGGQEPTGRPYWLALGSPAPEWDAYRDRVLARLNESRSVLVKNHAFVFLLLPAHFESRAAEVAPDLWSIRSARYVVTPWFGLKMPTHISSESESVQGVQPVAANDPILHTWQVQWEAWSRDRSQQLSPNLAWLLVDDLLKQKQLEQIGQARRIAMQALKLCRQLRVVKGDTPESLRDLAVSFEKVGDAKSEAGRGEQALVAYRKSLRILSQLRQKLGESPQVLRELSISLRKVGDAESQIGRSEQALGAYRESLEIFRQLRQVLGDSPQVLRDLSYAWNKVGSAEDRVGRNEQALVAYREALELLGKLREKLGDSPQVLRELSYAWNKIGSAESHAGRGEQALIAYRNALDLRRQLHRELGDSPEVLSDLSISLRKVGDAQSQLGRGEQALAAYQEGLKICRQLREKLGDSQQVLDDLAVSLGRLAKQPGLEMQARQSHFNEALLLLEQLVPAFPQNPWYCKHLEELRSLAPFPPAPSADAS